MHLCYQVQGKRDMMTCYLSQIPWCSMWWSYISSFCFMWFREAPRKLFLIGVELASCRTLDKTIANLETELSAARTLQDSFLNGSPVSEEYKASESTGRRKYLMVIGINTAFSSRKRRDSIRNTWMPQGLFHNDFPWVPHSFLMHLMVWNIDSELILKTRRNEEKAGGREGDHNSFCYWSQVCNISLFSIDSIEFLH